MQIQVRINEEGALRNQRYAFTDRFTLISELLQNARRAGATQIEVHYDAASKVLQVKDDGRGIDDFQKLLSFNESGWDASTCADEQPFGIGFSKCLYAASRCIVASHRQRVDFDTGAALAQTPIEVMQTAPTDTVAGTRIELHGVDLPDLGARIETLCQGFPISVLFNGKALERRFAQAHLATLSSAVGAVHLVGTRDGRFRHGTMVFLQGFCVLNTGYTDLCQVNVVHLDSRQFVARLPDRDKLIDEDVQRRRIESELKDCWRQILEVAKTQLTADRFVEQYYPAMRAWGHVDLLNDIDVLPRELCDAVVGYPIQDDAGNRDYVQHVTTAPTRGEIESASVTLVDLDGVGEDNAARWMLARAKGYLVFDWGGLHADHWAQRHVRYQEDDALEVEALSEQNRTALEGRWVWPTVILCDAVLIRLGSESVEITGNGVYHDGSLYIAADETSGESVRQASSFTDENDQFLESDLNADRDALADLIRHLRSIDPVQTLDSLLQELRLGKYPLLHGKAFHLSVGVGPDSGHSIELVG